MARVGKEQVFFIGTLAVTGLLGAFLFMDEWKPKAPPKGKAPDAALLVKKDVASAPRGALADTGWTRAAREAFREPRDWLPLPPANLERPPLRDPAYVPPPPRTSVGLDRLGLYRQPTKVTPHAFPEESAQANETPAEDVPANAASAATANEAAAAKTSAPAAGSGSPSGATTVAALLADEDAELKKLFDWIEVVADPKPWYGFIENKDKFSLNDRLDEKVQFRRLNPKNRGLMGSGSIERTRIKPGGIHFADTAANRTEVLLRQHPESQWSPNRLPAMLDVIEQVLAFGREDAAVYRRAAEQLVKYVALDPKHPRTYELLADARAATLDFEGELKALKQADAAGIESPGLIVRRARWLGRTGAGGGALARLANGVARFPNDRGLHLSYGRALLAEGSPENVALALEQFQKAEGSSETGEQRMEVIAEVGAALLEQGHAERALQESKRILGVDKGSPLGLRLAGAAQLALGRAKEAEEAWELLLQAAPTQAWASEAALSLGIARTRLGEFDDARADARSGPQLDPRTGAWSAVVEADLLAVTDHLEGAVVKCRDAVARAPDDPYLRYALGRFLRRSGDLEAGHAELRRALELGAAFPDLFTELGFLALQESRADDARRYFEESLAREDRDETKLYLAHAHLLAEDWAPARTLFESLNNAKPTGEALLGLAYCFYKRGESPAAQQLWSQVKDDLPSAHADDKAYAEKWLANVLDLESKQAWEDTIQWREVGNGWDPDERFQLASRIQPGSYRISGTQRPGTTVEQWSWLRRDVELAQFFEFEVEVAIFPENQGRAGFGLAHFIGGAASQQAPQIRASLMLAIDPDGQLLIQHREHVDDAEWTKVKNGDQDMKVDVRSGDPLTLTLRRKERGSPFFQFFVDGAAAGPPIEMNPWRGKSKQQLSALFFVAAPGGKKADAELRRARRIEFLGMP